MTVIRNEQKLSALTMAQTRCLCPRALNQFVLPQMLIKPPEGSREEHALSLSFLFTFADSNLLHDRAAPGKVNHGTELVKLTQTFRPPFLYILQGGGRKVRNLSSIFDLQSPLRRSDFESEHQIGNLNLSNFGAVHFSHL